MAKQYKTKNVQTTVFRLVNSDNKTLGFVNILDDLDPQAYSVMEDHLLHLLETKQVTIQERDVYSGDDDVTADFVLPDYET